MLEVISSYDEHNLVPPKLITEKQKVDGIIIIGRPRSDYLKMLYQNKKIPMVFMDFYDDEGVFDCIVSASFNGMHRMTDYLIKNGIRVLHLWGRSCLRRALRTDILATARL